MPSGSSQPRSAPADLHWSDVDRPGVCHAPRKPEHEPPRTPGILSTDLVPQAAEPEPMPPEPDQIRFGKAGVIDGVIPVHGVPFEDGHIICLDL